ncbi:carbohydrate porin [Vibrio crassostreae]|uniref:carbohydrate porin n=1 Tax=Vibrio crassostreae TaxID=246167 RepID=UPI001B311956|nr:carbohydrate porin [Vibrio crassostreae]
MKLSKLTLACLVATAGLSTVPAAYAEKSDGFEFHGYFRAGALFSVEDDLKRAKFPATKETLGRLGIESDNHYELALQKNFETDDGQKIRIKTRAGADNHNTANNQLGSNVNSSDIGIMETFVEFEGVTDTGVFWGGKRFYGKDNYIFMTDFFYTDMSGTGVGIEGIELGSNKWDFAYIASDKSDDDDGRWGSNTNNTMHAVHVGVNLGKFEIHAMGKYLPDNSNITGTTTDNNGNEIPVISDDFAETGFEVTGIYHADSLWGLPVTGFSKTILQVGTGLGSGQLLGGTLTEYNAYKPGTGAGQGQAFMTEVKDGDNSVRFLSWGGLFPEDSKMNYFTSIQGQYNDFDDSSNDYWVSAMVRPTYNMNQNFFIATEFGYQYSAWEDSAGMSDNADVFKATISPTVVVNTGMGPAPEVRFLATYLSDAGTNSGDSDIIVGIQADMWW